METKIIFLLTRRDVWFECVVRSKIVPLDVCPHRILRFFPFSFFFFIFRWNETITMVTECVLGKRHDEMIEIIENGEKWNMVSSSRLSRSKHHVVVDGNSGPTAAPEQSYDLQLDLRKKAHCTAWSAIDNDIGHHILYSFFFFVLCFVSFSSFLSSLWSAVCVNLIFLRVAHTFIDH